MTHGHTVTITPSDRHVEVRLGGALLANSDRPLLLDETGLPTRYYVPRADVRMELLHHVDHSTHCPFKGDASYWSVTVDGVTHDRVAWSYESPIPAAAAIAGHLCFYPERVDLAVS
jgi:uncharacterized protein (DUF427 family)